MVSYRYDKLQFSTALPNFINLPTVTGNINVSGTIPNGGGQNFTLNLTANTFSTFNDVRMTGSGVAIYLISNTAISTIWTYAGAPGNTETVQTSVSFIGTTATITITVNNFTGASLTLVPQTFTVDLFGYQLPF